MEYVNNLQEFLANVLVPISAIVAGVLLAALVIMGLLATMVNALMDR